MHTVPFSIKLLKAHRAQVNAIRPRMAEIGLSIGQPKVLDFLLRHEGCMQKELAALCDIEPATISRILDKMEAAGLISRTVAADNKRAVIIHLTDLGRKKQSEMMEIRREVEVDELRGFSPEEQEQFYRFLERLYDNLTQERDG